MRAKLSSGGILRCDIEDCTVMFVSYSFIALLRAQAKNVGGWHRLRFQGQTIDACPACGMEIAEDRRARKISAQEKRAARIARRDAKRNSETVIAKAA